MEAVIKQEVPFSFVEDENLPLKFHQKQYRCKVCQKKFRKWNVARLHVEVIHMKLYQYQCKDCKRIFIRPTTVKKHLSSCHPGSKQSNFLHFKNEEAVKYVVTIKSGKSVKKSNQLSGREEKLSSGFELEDNPVDSNLDQIENDDPNHVNIVSEKRVTFQEKGGNKKISSSWNQENVVNKEEFDQPFDDYGAQYFNDFESGDDLIAEPVLDPVQVLIKVQEPKEEEGGEAKAVNDDVKGKQESDDQLNPIEKPYKCKFCPLTFRQLKGARNHVDRYHLFIKQYRCVHCGKAYRERGAVLAHCAKMHEKEPPGVDFEDNKQSLEHIETASWYKTEKRLKCRLCYQTFSRHKTLREHCLSRHGVEPDPEDNPLLGSIPSKIKPMFHCNFCKKEFSNRPKAKSHIDKEHMDHDKFKCGICFLGFDTRSAVKEHFAAKHKKKKFLCTTRKGDEALDHITVKYPIDNLLDCPECYRKFPSHFSLATHVRCSHPEKNDEFLNAAKLKVVKNFICPKCNKSFPSEEKYYTHQHRLIPCDLEPSPAPKEILVDDATIESSFKALEETDHRYSELKKFICLICNLRRQSSEIMRAHVKSTHFTEHPYKCDQCPKMYKGRFYLKLHKEKAHLKLKAATCHICGHTSTNASSLKHHIRTHETEKKFKCDLCQKSFKQLECLRHHKNWIHFGKNTPLPCEICGALVRGKNYLKRHIETIHQGIKNHECPKCGWKFQNKPSMLEHIKAVHDKIKDLKCDYCDMMFSNKTPMRQHITAVHLKLKKHECSVCHRMFAARHAMIAHCKTVHGLTGITRVNNKFVLPPQAPQENTNTNESS